MAIKYKIYERWDGQHGIIRIQFETAFYICLSIIVNNIILVIQLLYTIYCTNNKLTPRPTENIISCLDLDSICRLLNATEHPFDKSGIHGLGEGALRLIFIVRYPCYAAAGKPWKHDKNRPSISAF